MQDVVSDVSSPKKITQISNEGLQILGDAKSQHSEASVTAQLDEGIEAQSEYEEDVVAEKTSTPTAKSVVRGRKRKIQSKN